MAGIYVHIPFCKKACHYCNFHFSTSMGLQQPFVKALMSEIHLQRNYLNEPVNTLYFGGGTPSILHPDELGAMVDGLRQTFDIASHAEVTLEANPDDIVGGKPAAWQQAGFNRLSIGVQSFFEEDLRWMNRAHNAVQALQSIQMVQQMGFNNITIDLIYGGPTLSDEHWIQNIDKAVQLGIPHISCYALTVEPGTAMAAMINKQKIAGVDPDKQARHFDILVEKLTAAGYDHYEISNFARPGFRSRHNSSYWQGTAYLGLGPSAHSFNGHSRQWNIANNAEYIRQINNGIIPCEVEVLTPHQQLNEYIMTGLRTEEGISLSVIEAKFGTPALQRLLQAAAPHINRNTVIQRDGSLRLTPGGKFLADGIAADLFQL